MESKELMESLGIDMVEQLSFFHTYKKKNIYIYIYIRTYIHLYIYIRTYIHLYIYILYI